MYSIETTFQYSVENDIDNIKYTWPIHITVSNISYIALGLFETYYHFTENGLDYLIMEMYR